MSDDTKAITKDAKAATMELGDRGLVLRSLDDIWRYAGIIQQSGVAPKGMDTREQIVIAIQLGQELGLPMLSAIQNIAVINGRPTVWGDAIPALCMNSPAWDQGAFSEFIDGVDSRGNLTDTSMAICRVRRKGGQLVERIYSVADAKKAGLWGKAGPWQQYPKRMLQMRARSWAIRDTFPDVLKGLQVREEVEDFVDVEPMPARPLIQPPKRVEMPAPQTETAETIEPPTQAPAPDNAHETGYAEGEIPNEDEGRTRSLVRVTDAQRKRFYAIGKGNGKTDKQMKDYLSEIWNITSTKDITIDIYDEVCEWAGR